MIPHNKMRSPAFPPRRPSAILRYLLPAFLLISIFYYLRQPPQSTPSTGIKGLSDPGAPIPDLSHKSSPGSQSSQNGDQLSHQSPAGKNGEQPSEYTAKQQHDINQPRPAQEPLVDSSSSGAGDSKTSHAPGSHPIDYLILNANKQFDHIMSRESHSLAAAAAAYRKARGRHPPPGFDQWYAFASERGAVMVEDFWDQIYHDLEPFWALDTNELRKAAWEYEMTIKVRSGVASAVSDWFWTQIWLNLISTVSHLLPDMDIALNPMDEPRLVVPWENMDEYMKKASSRKGMVPASQAENSYERLPEPGQGPDKNVALPEKNWEDTSKYLSFVITLPASPLPRACLLAGPLEAQQPAHPLCAY